MNQWFEKLVKLKNNAYTPYSNFNVSCIIVLDDNQQISGVNVENAAYPSSLCAERTALAQVYTQGYRKENIKNLYLYTDSTYLATPCGQCRQVICELVDENCAIEIYNKNANVTTLLVKQLLPFAFTKEDLK